MATLAIVRKNRIILYRFVSWGTLLFRGRDPAVVFDIEFSHFINEHLTPCGESLIYRADSLFDGKI